MAKGQLHLDDVLEVEPDDAAGDRRHPRSWLRENWMPLAMFICWAFTQMWSGTDWLHQRVQSETATKADVERLRQELQSVQATVPATYVRQDVFTQVLININQRLTSIDGKLERR